MQHVRVTALTLPSPRFVAAAAIGACLMACAGCSTTPGGVFDTSGGTHEWPPPPDAPRIRYVGQLKGAVDLKPAKSGIDSLGESASSRLPSITPSVPDDGPGRPLCVTSVVKLNDKAPPRGSTLRPLRSSARSKAWAKRRFSRESSSGVILIAAVAGTSR